MTDINVSYRSIWTDFNMQMVLAGLVEGKATRSQVIKRIDLPRTTTYDTLQRLLIAGLVTREVKQNGKRGRPKILWSLKINV